MPKCTLIGKCSSAEGDHSANVILPELEMLIIGTIGICLSCCPKCPADRIGLARRSVVIVDGIKPVQFSPRISCVKDA